MAAGFVEQDLGQFEGFAGLPQHAALTGIRTR